MIQYVMTALAGLAVGILGLRLWQSSQQGQSLVATNVPASDGALADGDVSGNSATPRTWFGRKFAMPSALARLQGRSSTVLLIAAAAVLVVALAAHFLRGDTAADTTGAGVPLTQAGLDGAQLDDVDTMIQRLAARLEAEPDDGEGQRMLGWSYLMTDRPDLALPAYQRALELLPDSASVHAGHGEVLVALADGRVTDEANASFNRALTLDPAEPRARYFKGLWDDQHGRKQQALDAWVALARTGPADAPWQVEVRSAIDRLAAELGVETGLAPLTTPVATAAADLPSLDPQAIASANSLPAGQREAMVDDMVGRLANRLRTNPQDPEGWLRLIRSRMVMEQPEQAGRDLASARTALAGNAAALSQIRALATELGVPGA